MQKYGRQYPDAGYVIAAFGYKICKTANFIRVNYKPTATCQETAPEAIVAFLEWENFEDVIRIAVTFGGDTDTLTAIAGSMAEAYYGVPEWMKTKCRKNLDKDILKVIKKFQNIVFGGGGKMKKTIKIIAIIAVSIVASLLLSMFAKQCCLGYIFDNKNEVEWEDVPKWLIYGGQERYDELYRMGSDHIRTLLESKYVDATKVEINDVHVMLTGCEQSVDCIEYQNSEYFYNDIYAALSTQRWLEYSGVVMAECNIDGKYCVAYVDLHSEDWTVYDTYQREEIYAAVTEYFDNLIDTKPLYNSVRIEELDVYGHRIGPNYPEYYDMDGACHNYFDGDVEKFLTDNDIRNDIRISVIYNSDQPLPIDGEFIKNIGQDMICIVRIADADLAKQYAEGFDLELYDVWNDVDEAYISRGAQITYGMQWLWEYKDYYWTPKTDAEDALN